MEKTENNNKFKRVHCPFCGASINLATSRNVDFDMQKANIQIWCHKCEKRVRLSLKKD